MSLLGIDVGTTGCKAAVFSVEGRPLAAAYREYAPLAGGMELDSDAVLSQVWATIAEAAAGAAGDPVTALSISSMGEAVTPLDAAGNALDVSILSGDPRGGEYVGSLRERFSQEQFYRINPNILGVPYSLPKILWLREHRPEVYRRTAKFMLWGDLVAHKLGGAAVTSPSLGNRTLLLDIRREDWSDELLSATGVERAKLPDVVASRTVCGEVSRAMAERLGVPAGAKIVVGGHDQALNALGAGVIEPGQAVCGIGTFECTTPVFDRIPDAATMIAAGLNVEHHVVPGRYVSFLYNQAGSLVRWYRDTFAAADARGLKAGEDIYDVLSAEMPAQPTDLIVLPYFGVTGPPKFLADASGVVAGLKASTRRGEILKAIMEGVTLYFVQGIEALRGLGIDTSEFLATGGGAKSDAWLQIKADILGVPFVRPANTECGAAGAAMLAGLGTGVYSEPAEAVSAFVRRQTLFQPDAGRHRAYAAKHALYRELLARVEDLMPRFAAR